MLTAAEEPKAYTIEGFGKKYATSRRTTYREINAGRLKAIKLGQRTLIPADSAEAWFNALPVLDLSSAA
jgi:excisionase family DNA binding protein